MVAQPLSYFVPTSLEHALTILSGGDVKIIAGGTDFFPSLGDNPAPTKILDVSRLSDMCKIIRTKSGWQIGGSVTWSQLVQAELPPCFERKKLAHGKYKTLERLPAIFVTPPLRLMEYRL